MSPEGESMVKWEASPTSAYWPLILWKWGIKQQLLTFLEKGRVWASLLTTSQWRSFFWKGLVSQTGLLKLTSAWGDPSAPPPPPSNSNLPFSLRRVCQTEGPLEAKPHTGHQGKGRDGCGHLSQYWAAREQALMEEQRQWRKGSGRRNSYTSRLSFSLSLTPTWACPFLQLPKFQTKQVAHKCQSVWAQG